jgi:hypothetical protein
MTDQDAGELFALARDSFRGGQTNFQIQALPFRMTAQNLARHRGDPNMDFWKMLKVGSDNFELTLKPPKIDVCDRRYVFNADSGGASFSPSAACPAYTQPEALVAALERKQAADEAAILTAITTMEAKVEAEADAAALAAAKAAEKERLAAERAAQPSLVARLLGRGQQEPPPNLDHAPVASFAPVSEPAPKAIASVPLPAPRPAAATVAPATTTVAAPATATATVAPAVVAEPPQPAVGTFVKKKFLWPGEEGEDPG